MSGRISPFDRDDKVIHYRRKGYTGMIYIMSGQALIPDSQIMMGRAGIDKSGGIIFGRALARPKGAGQGWPASACDHTLTFNQVVPALAA